MHGPRSARVDARSSAGLSSAEFRASEALRERGRGLAERGSPRRTPQPENGSTTSDLARVTWPSTSSSPATPIEPNGSPRASRTSSSSGDTGSSPRSPARIAASGSRSSRPGSARTTSRSSWRRSWRSRNVRPSSGSGRAARSNRRSRVGDLIISSGCGPARGDDELLRPRGVSRGRRLRGGRGTRRGSGEAWTPGACRDNGHGTRVLRCARAPDPAVAHPLP